MSNPARSLIARWIIAAVVLAALSSCAKDVSPIGCEDPDFDCYSNQALLGIKLVRENISYWSNINLAAQIFIALSGMVATVMIALQGDENRYWTRPIGLVATALVTGLTSALVSFHVPDNIDKLVDIVDRMVTTQVEFDYRAIELKGAKSKQEAEEAFKTDPTFRKAVNELTRKFANDYNKIKNRHAET